MDATQQAAPNKSSFCPFECWKHCSNGTLAFILLRLFLAARFIHAFIGKIQNDDGSFSLDNLDGFQSYIHNAFENLLPSILLHPYTALLPWAELILGVLLLLGLWTRPALFLTGLAYLSLAFGQMLLQEYANVGMIGNHLAFTAGALLLVDYNKFALDCWLNPNSQFKCRDCETKPSNPDQPQP